MLRLVHPAPAGNDGPRPPRRRGTRASSLSLTEDEARHVRAAIRGAARTYGSLAALARVIGVWSEVLTKKSVPHPGLVFAVARIAGLSVDAMLSPIAGVRRAFAEPDAHCSRAGGRRSGSNSGSPAGTQASCKEWTDQAWGG
jgi:hypothetical protein